MRTFVIGRGEWWTAVTVGRLSELEDALSSCGCLVPFSIAARAWHTGLWDSLEERERFHGWNVCEVLL